MNPRTTADMSADEIAAYRGPRYCCTARWLATEGDHYLYSDLEEPSEQALQFVQDELRRAHSDVQFSRYVTVPAHHDWRETPRTE